MNFEVNDLLVFIFYLPFSSVEIQTIWSVYRYSWWVTFYLWRHGDMDSGFLPPFQEFEPTSWMQKERLLHQNKFFLFFTSF